MQITILIPNYNGENLLRENMPKLISSLGEHKFKCEILVADDNSRDNSITEILKIREKFKDVKINFFKNDLNLGFASNVNKGVRRSLGNIVILLNTDVIPEKGFIEPLLKKLREPEVFAVGCLEKSVEPDGRIELRGRGVGKWSQGFLVHSKGDVDEENTLWVSGGSGAFNKEIWEKLGGMNDLYSPFYWEDIDISYRAIKSGFKTYFEPNSVVIHEHERGAIKTRYTSRKVKTIVYRNQFIFVWCNLTDSNLVFQHFSLLPFHLTKAFASFDIPMLLGFIKAVYLLPVLLAKRIENKKLFKKTDAEVVSQFDEDINNSTSL